jgi:hypothetical protein
MARIVTATTPNMIKGGRRDKATGAYPNPFILPNGSCRVVKHTETVVMLNNSYETAVNNRVEKTTGKHGHLKADPMSGRVWVEGMENLVSVKTEESNRDRDLTYLRVYFNMANSPISVRYVLDGRSATPKEVEEIEAWLTVKSDSRKQAEEGLDAEDQIVPRDYKLASVKHLECGDYKFTA